MKITLFFQEKNVYSVRRWSWGRAHGVSDHWDERKVEEAQCLSGVGDLERERFLMYMRLSKTPSTNL